MTKRSINNLFGATLMLSFSSVALADEPTISSFDDEFDFIDEGAANAAHRLNEATEESDSFDLYDDDEDDFGDFQLSAPVVAADSSVPRLPYPVAGRDPLDGNYAAEIVFTDRDSVVVELPVLISRSPADFTGEFWLNSELFINGEKAGESRQWFGNASLAQSGPTIAFVKMLAPVNDALGEVEIQVSRQAGDQEATPLFSQSINYNIQ
jgi:hypothetical protein